MIAVNDGRIVRSARNAELGRYVVLQDVYGNRYTYAHLGSLAPSYPVPKPQPATAASDAAEVELPKADARPTAPATRRQRSAPPAADRAAAPPSRGAAAAPQPPPPARRRDEGAPVRAPGTAGRVRRRRQAPARRARPAARRASTATSRRRSRLDPHDYLLKPLQRGASVIAGTILGRIGRTDPALAPHVEFAIRPAGRGAPQIDPKPILDGWKLLESTAIYRANGKNAFFGADADAPSIGQVLLMSKEQLQQRVLADPNVDIYALRPPGRRDRRRSTAACSRRSSSSSPAGLKPTVTALRLRPQLLTRPPATSPSTRAATPSTSRRSTASRSPATRAPARSPTSRSAAC